MYMYYQRNPLPDAIQIYPPTTLIVILSWLAFWIDPKSTAARSLYSLGTVLAMIATHLYIQSISPETKNYLTFSGVYVFMCAVYVFLSHLETLIVLCLNKRSDDAKNDIDDVYREKKTSTCGARLDVCFQFLLPLSFMILAGLYFAFLHYLYNLTR